MTHVVNQITPVAAVHGAASTLMIINHDALDTARRGEATTATVDKLVGAMNVTLTLALTKDTLGKDWIPEIKDALDALYAMARRPRFVFTGPELTAMNLAMEIHDQQLRECTVAELDRAISLLPGMYRAGKLRKISTQ